MKAARARICKSSILLEVRRPDCTHPFHVRYPSTDLGVYLQIFHDKEYDFVTDVPPEVIIDAGANIGCASIYFSNRFPQAKIIAIEPEAGNFELLKQNVAPYPNITPVLAALWHREETLEVIESEEGAWGFTTQAGTDSANGTAVAPAPIATRQVRGMTISSLMEEYQLSRISILKIDIEGAEKEVFSDTLSWIDKVDSVIIELHDELKAGCSQSFYEGSPGFDLKWQQGENIYLSRTGCLSKISS